MVSIADQPASVPPATSTRSIPSGTGTAYHRFWLTKADRCSCHRLTSRACSACAACSERSWSAREPLDPQPLGVDPPPQRPLAPPDRVAAQPRGQQAGGDGRRGDDGGHPAGGGARGERERDHGRGGGRQPRRPRDAGFLPPLGRQPVLGQPLPLRRHPAGAAAARDRRRGRVLPPQVQRGHARAPGRPARRAAGRGSRAGTIRPGVMSRRRGQLTARTNSAGPSASKVRAGTTGLGTRSAAAAAADAGVTAAGRLGLPGYPGSPGAGAGGRGSVPERWPASAAATGRGSSRVPVRVARLAARSGSATR